jgi:hypothetical protein
MKSVNYSKSFEELQGFFRAIERVQGGMSDSLASVSRSARTISFNKTAYFQKRSEHEA